MNNEKQHITKPIKNVIRILIRRDKTKYAGANNEPKPCARLAIHSLKRKEILDRSQHLYRIDLSHIPNSTYFASGKLFLRATINTP